METGRYRNHTELDLIQEAWDLQNACNLSGVVHSFSHAITRLREIFEDRRTHTDFTYSGTDLNEHIMCKLFTSKILHLAGDLPADLSVYEIDFNKYGKKA